MRTEFIILLFVGIMAFTFLYTKLLKGMQTEALYGLYDVRDRLIALVADGTLSEDGETFYHYYDRVNSVLNVAPNIGVDDILHGIFSKFDNPDDFEEALAHAKQRRQTILQSTDFESKEVCLVVEDYYRSIRKAILAHSSILRILNFVAFFAAGAILSHLPIVYSQAKDAIFYVESGRDKIRTKPVFTH